MKQILAVGKIINGDWELQASSLFNPTDVVEHTVNQWTAEKVVAETRVNGRMINRGIFSGDFANADAKEWCDLHAPMASEVEYKEVTL